MLVSEQWLRDWVPIELGPQAIAECLTLAGLEVAGVHRAGPPLAKVVVGEIIGQQPHPASAHLSICSVDVGRARPLSIVCGAPNVAPAQKVPTALIGAELPDARRVSRVRIHDIPSSGMLCSGAELGLDDDAAGILVLDADAENGMTLCEHLGLDDWVLDIEVTPNRGDCLSVRGVAREVAAVTGAGMRRNRLLKVLPTSKRRIPIRVDARRDCPRYVGRVIENVDPTARTPDLIRDRLRRCGVRSVNAIVDVTNYVMLELGQPLHAFDLDTLDGAVIVRYSRAGESLVLLDGSTLDLQPETLVIADQGRVIALAGIMGGTETGIGENTANVLLEAAHFSPGTVGNRARGYGMQTDASQRFERGVDPELPEKAIERATQLLLSLCGGRPGPVIEARSARDLPRRDGTVLRNERLARMLGARIPEQQTETILRQLGMKVRKNRGGWHVVPPSWRFDITAEHDLVEEVARVHGYDAIPSRLSSAMIGTHRGTESRLPERRVRAALVDRDYQEVITYSFVDPQLQELLYPRRKAVHLTNPIASNMAVMRLSLWPGLLTAAAGNYNRQHRRIRLFEIGHVFGFERARREEKSRIAGLVIGPAIHDHWSAETRDADFFDIKGDLDALFALAGKTNAVEYRRIEHPALHPGQAAAVDLGNRQVGWIGQLHPARRRHFDFDHPLYLFEVDFDAVADVEVPDYRSISRFPAVRRDLALTVGDSVTARQLTQAIRVAAGDILTQLEIFDVYRGGSIGSGEKSVAFRLTLQDSSRTLTDLDVEAATNRIVGALRDDFGVELRH